MSENCSSNCGSCSVSGCSSRQPSKEDFLEPLNVYSNVKKVIGVVSGKGGVGKSLITSYLSVLFQRKGYKTAILDADVTGPSIPKTFGIHDKAQANELGIIPAVSRTGIKMMSVNLLLDSDDTPVIWRGPIVAGTVKQFWSQVLWEDIDYMFVDMPPGTGDVPLTVFQSIPLDGIIIVTSPQELVSMIVSKAVNMAKQMDIPILGIVENYSYITCGSCGEKIHVFGESHTQKTAEKYRIPVLGNIPIDPSIAKAVDDENIEELQGDWLDAAVTVLADVLTQEEQGIQEDEDTDNQEEAIKIAVATDEDKNIFQHFGKCPEFTVFTTKGSRIVSRASLKSGAAGHSELAGLLMNDGVDVLICGGIGQGAMDMLKDSDITVVPGMKGSVEQTIVAYLAGTLSASTDPTCDHHHEEHEGECGECHCH